MVRIPCVSAWTGDDPRALGVDDLTINEILRHSDVSVTRASYIRRVDEKSVEAMYRLDAERTKACKGGRFDTLVTEKHGGLTRSSHSGTPH